MIQHVVPDIFSASGFVLFLVCAFILKVFQPLCVSGVFGFLLIVSHTKCINTLSFVRLSVYLALVSFGLFNFCDFPAP